MADGLMSTVNFKNNIILTSNLKMDDLRLREVPEFINRIDRIVKYCPLGM